MLYIVNKTIIDTTLRHSQAAAPKHAMRRACARHYARMRDAIRVFVRTCTTRNTTKILLWCAGMIGFFLATFPAHAQTEARYALYLDAPTIERGYTVNLPDGSLQIGVLPHTVSRPVTVEFYPSPENISLPNDKILVTSLVRYAVVPVTNNTLEVPIHLKFFYPENERRYKEIYQYNEAAGAWEHVSGGINTDQHYLTAATTRASGLIAVFADKLDRAEYIKEDIHAPTILIQNTRTNDVMLERNADVVRPIASLTKLMTAAVFLDHNPGWDTNITISAQDHAEGAALPARAGDVLRAEDLFYAMLVRSANNAANALARATGLNEEAFVDAMNAKARALGMHHTSFVEPTGLSESNVSTAYDLALLSRHVLANPLFVNATTRKTYTLIEQRSRKQYTVANTNKLLSSSFVVTGSKTGYTREAGRCLIMRANNRAGEEVLAIIMGVEEPGAQWDDMRTLLHVSLDESAAHFNTVAVRE